MPALANTNPEQLLQQLETYTELSLSNLTTAQQRIEQLEQANAELLQRIQVLESSQAKLKQQVSLALANPDDAKLSNRSDALMLLIKETLGVDLNEAKPTPNTENLDQLKPEQRLAYWIKTYPSAFMPGQPQPLKIGIHKDLFNQEGGDLKKIRRALACYVKVPRYLRCIKTGAVRLDLNGNNAGFVNTQEAEFAQQHLEELAAHKKQREEHKKQQLQQQQTRATEHRMQSKLNALLEMNRRN